MTPANAIPPGDAVPLGDLAPVPPDFIAGHTVVWTFTTVWIALSGIALLWALWTGLRGTTWVPLMCWIGGLICSAQEPMLDHLVHLWWAADAPVTYQQFDMHQPVWVLGIYTFCLSVVPYVMWRIFQRGVTKRTIMLLWLAEAIAEACIEIPAIHFGAWDYYGDQPFEVFGFPLFNFWVNGAGFMACGVILYVLYPTGRSGPRQWRALFAPLGFALIWMTVPVPAAISVNTHMPTVAAWIVNLLSLGLTYAAVRAMAGVVAVDGSPLVIGRPPRHVSTNPDPALAAAHRKGHSGSQSHTAEYR